MSKTLNVNEVIEILVEKTNYSTEDIKVMIQETVDSMDSMVTEEGAAYVVADNLGVSLEVDQTSLLFTIDQLMPGQSNISIVGRVRRIYPTRHFTRKDGNPGKVRNIEILDQYGSVRLALWDIKCSIVEEKGLVVGDIVRVMGVNAKSGREGDVELSLSLHGTIEKEVSTEFQSLPQITHALAKKISEISVTDDEISIIAKIIRKRDVYEFEKEGRKSRVINVDIADETGQVILSAWQENVDRILKLKNGEQVKLTDLRVGTNKYNELQVTLTDSSSISITDELDLSSVELTSAKDLESIIEIKDGMNVSINGKVVEVGDLKTFEREGQTRKVQNIVVMDSTAVIRVTFWGDDTTKLNSINTEDMVRLENCRARLSNFSNEIELSFNRVSKISRLTDIDADAFKFSDESIKISEVKETIRGVTVKGIVINIFDKRDVTLSDGREASVQNVNIQTTDGSYAKVAAWDQTIKDISELNEGDGILLQNVRVKPNNEGYNPEITISSSSVVRKLDSAELGPIIQTADTMMGKSYERIEIQHLTSNTRVHISGTIVKLFRPTFYDSCTHCKKKVLIESPGDITGICSVHGEVEFTPALILTLVLDDTTGTVICKFFNQLAEKLIGMNSIEAKQMIDRLKDQNAITQKLEMKKIWVKGIVNYNDVRDEYTLNVNTFDLVDLTKENEDLLRKYDSLD